MLFGAIPRYHRRIHATLQGSGQHLPHGEETKDHQVPPRRKSRTCQWKSRASHKMDAQIHRRCTRLAVSLEGEELLKDNILLLQWLRGH